MEVIPRKLKTAIAKLLARSSMRQSSRMRESYVHLYSLIKTELESRKSAPVQFVSGCFPIVVSASLLLLENKNP